MEAAVQLHGRSVLDELLGHPVRLPGLHTCGIVRENKTRAAQFNPGSFCSGFGTGNVGSEHFEAVGVEVHPIGAFGLCRTQDWAALCIKECLDESDLSVLQIDLRSEE